MGMLICAICEPVAISRATRASCKLFHMQRHNKDFVCLVHLLQAVLPRPSFLFCCMVNGVARSNRASTAAATAQLQHLLAQPVQQTTAACQVADQQLLLRQVCPRARDQCCKRLTLLLFCSSFAARTHRCRGRACSGADAVLAVAIAAAAAPAQSPSSWAAPCWRAHHSGAEG